MMKFAFALLMISGFAFASSQEEKLFQSKVKFDGQVHLLKLLQEKEILKIQNKNLESALESVSFDTSCVQWVYLGPSTREEAVAACRGVESMECVEFVYQGPSTRVEAAQACRGVSDMECVRFVYQGPATRVEAARSCSGRGPHRPGPGGGCVQ